ncbi:MAG: ATP-binding cassette domain-containing protein [Candidatus Woesearchaeota archaeon]
MANKMINKEYAVKVRNLSKDFKTKIRGEGLKEALKSVLKPHYKIIKAVHAISFEVKRGELVAFIGPNGAGKSTTLKMLSGILYPDTGEIRVLNYNPTKDRKKMAYRIGTVFGQKSQLWFHLPAIDSFNLFAKIYEINGKEYQTRLSGLVKRFELEEIMQQPVRKLSLGQRMKCELVLALLHGPDILFLDEPTIGLDVVAKRSIRELIKEINEKENVTIILTSHDMTDIEKICKRAIIINKGVIVYDGSIKELKREYVKKKTIKVLAEGEIRITAEKGVNVLKKSVYGAKIEIDGNKTSLKNVVAKIMKQNEVVDITIEEPPIEEIIENIYRK